MNEVELIVEMLGQTFNGRAWHGPSFMTVLSGVDMKQAIERPVDGRHTIWEIVNHCRFWVEAVAEAVRSKMMPDIKSEEDWPKMGNTNEDWAEAKEKLKNTCEELVNSIKALTEDKLAQTIQGSYNEQSYAIAARRMFHGLSDHNVYHAGQISILRKKKT